ncbi:MAG TPA: ImmA/IrrE family metallo-endopeptidase, partial [Polyangiaceae bacterium]
PGDRIEPVIARLGGTIRYLDRVSSLDGQAFDAPDGQAFDSPSGQDHLKYVSPLVDGSLLVRGPNDFEIFLSAYTGIERDRFTIAHELGHYVLHSDFGRIQIRAARLGSTRIEWEANWFAAAFLMPREDFTEAFRKYAGQVRALASRYVVSPKAAQVRAQSLGLIGV